MAFDERAFIRRVEAASPSEFAALLRHPSPDEEAALRVHLGDARYRRMHEMALTQSVKRKGARAPRGNVVLIHGIMGGELTAVRQGQGRQIWAKVLRLMGGGLRDLRLSADGRTEADGARSVEASGIMKKHYGEMLLALATNWNAQAFWFDWRRDLDTAASLLAARATAWFGPNAPFHIVAHSMGGLVSRTFILRNRAWWDSMQAADPALKRGGRLIMLGTPNHGSFAVPQIFTGLEGMVRKLALVDLRHGLDDVLDIVNGFPGSYQMLPSPFKKDAWAPLYDAGTYPVRVSQTHLDAARKHHDALRGVVDGKRMIYIAGCDQPTWADVDPARVGKADAYTATFDGDGRVSHELGLLDGVETYYVREDHGALSRNADIMATLDELLETGTTPSLARQPTKRRADPAEAAAALAALQMSDEREIEAYLQRTRTVRAVDAPMPSYLSSDERLVEDLLTRGFLSAPDEEESVSPPSRAKPSDRPRLRLRLALGGIQDAGVDGFGEDDRSPPVDAIAVGHYRDVKPTAAELALDHAISAALPAKGRRKTLAERDLIITQLTERGTIPGGLAQPFLLRDPRLDDAEGRHRIIAVVGMGVPGSFGAPELGVLVRELVWALGRMGHQHLATVMIGAGNGNIPIALAVRTWIQAIAAGLAGERGGRALRQITFVEFDPARVLEIDEQIVNVRKRLADLVDLNYPRLSRAARSELAQLAQQRAVERAERQLRDAREGRIQRVASTELPPTRVTFTRDGRNIRMGAITADAAIPERDVPLDPDLVAQANDELAGEGRLDLQLERGRFVERLIVPREMRDHLMSDAPLVLMLDATTARIHWEMVGQPRVSGGPAPAETYEYASHFLGTARGLTRQLRTSFAPPPEPPPPPRRVLRVLVIADPAADDHLPGAEEEGIAVARLFESFNRIYQSDDNRVEVVRLFGPSEATRTNVLRRVMGERFDVLHYAGHCRFDTDEPSNSGWVFTGGEVLSAHELNRIDRIPKFVFSNACESGITPDRSEKRNVALAPSFAESFFARGVGNFVCTAWPVDDLAARVFSLRLYGQLLGLDPAAGDDSTDVEPHPTALSDGPQAMHIAMHHARLAIMGTPNGLRTWGAYQHYGNPYFRLFDPMALGRGGRS